MRELSPIIIRRFAEFMITGAAASAIACGMCISGKLPNTNAAYFFCFGITALIFAAVNTVLMRQCYMSVLTKRDYYIANYISYAAFALINIIIFLTGNGYIYTWTYGITKLLRFCPPHLGTLTSAAIFHLFMAVLIFAAPLGLGRIKEELQEQLQNELDEGEVIF